MTSFEKYEFLKERLGAETLLEEFMLAMPTDELEDYCDWIGRSYDVAFDTEDDEE